jgi:N-acetylneuraminate lyase
MKLSGIIPALLTPFDGKGNVNYEMTRQIVEFHIGQGVTGEYVGGSTGEGFLLSEEERCKLAETVMDQVKGRVAVVVQVGSLTTGESCRLAAHAKEIGADGISSVPPFYYNVGFPGIKQHYVEIGHASDLPMYIYNIPGATGVNVTPAMFKEICEAAPTVVGMKFTSYNFFEMRQIIDLEVRGQKLNIVSGPDEMMVAAQAMGAQGAIGSTYNVLPKLFIDAYNAFNAGDVKLASELQGKANRVIASFLSYPGMSGLKEMMRLIGFDSGAGRPPMMPLSDAQKAEFHGKLEAAGFWDVAVKG